MHGYMVKAHMGRMMKIFENSGFIPTSNIDMEWDLWKMKTEKRKYCVGTYNTIQKHWRNVLTRKQLSICHFRKKCFGINLTNDVAPSDLNSEVNINTIYSWTFWTNIWDTRTRLYRNKFRFIDLCCDEKSC